ncbi:hypothetical protein ACE6H2_010637 [Prunus campanulata]
MSTSSSHGLRRSLCGVEMKLLLSTTKQHYNKYFWKCTRKYVRHGFESVLFYDMDVVAMQSGCMM